MQENPSVYAHSFSGLPEAKWEPLNDHLDDVARMAEKFAAAFGWGGLARVSGLLHDIGKCSLEFQAFLRQPAEGAERLRGPDHSTAGARTARRLYASTTGAGVDMGMLLAYIIAGHHCGLADWHGLEPRLDEAERKIPAFRNWERFVGNLPAAASLAGPTLDIDRNGQPFANFFLLRMVFSALVDADSLATEAATAKAEGWFVERGGHTSLLGLRRRLQIFMAKKERAAKPSALNALRARVLAQARSKALMAPGMFTLTVPTGGGKTLTSLAFALCHAVKNGLRRVIVVVPYTSIIEQTADEYRKALSSIKDVLEHHASFDWDRNVDARNPDADGFEALRRLRLASENWDMPIVVTTAVQFYESLFANKRSRCRKLHNLAKSVVVLDEAHLMPLKYLLPSMAALDELQRNYGASVVLCSATQPALRLEDGFEKGFDIDDDREIAPDPATLYAALDRFDIEWKDEPVSDDDIAERFQRKNRMLVIVNTRKHAKSIFEKIKKLPGACHLSTLMCPAHRRKVLERVKADLAAQKPIRLVSTSLIECGVDVDFPEVWRAATGLDAILQAGGRCNREGGPERGRLVVFEPLEEKPKDERGEFWRAAKEVRRNAEGPMNRLKPIRDYFSLVYWKRRDGGLDAAEIDGRKGILPKVAGIGKRMTFPFDSIAQAFVMIEDEKETIVVPWAAYEDDRTAEKILARIAAIDRPRRQDLRALQQYTVGISPKVRGVWLKNKMLAPVHPALGDTLLKFVGKAPYDERTGLDVDNPEVLPTTIA